MKWKKATNEEKKKKDYERVFQDLYSNPGGDFFEFVLIHLPKSP